MEIKIQKPTNNFTKDCVKLWNTKYDKATKINTAWIEMNKNKD